MNTKRLKGLAVVSIADGRKLGTVHEVYVEPATRQVVSFGLRQAGGLLHAASGPPLVVDTGNVHALGSDALTVADASALREAAGGGHPGVVSGEDLTKRKVVTEGGTYVGQVVSVELDPATFRLTAIEVSPGFFRSNKQIPDAQVISLGADVVVVSDTVCAPGAEDRVATEGDSVAGR
jgi:sporulation protein YlmC with PRC-barrel domain